MKTKLSLFFLCIFIYNCADEESDSSDNASDGECSPLIAVDSSRGECTETLSYTSERRTTSGTKDHGE